MYCTACTVHKRSLLPSSFLAPLFNFCLCMTQKMPFVVIGGSAGLAVQKESLQDKKNLKHNLKKKKIKYYRITP